MRVGVLVKTIGQEDDGANVHRPPPEIAEELTLQLNVLDVLRVLRRLDGRYRFVQANANGGGRSGVEVNLGGLAVEVAGFAIPVLPFPLIHREFQGAAVGAVERLVDIEDGLHVIIAGGDLRECIARISERGAVDDRRTSCTHVDSEDLLRIEPFIDRDARFRRLGSADDEDHVPIERLRP